LSGQQAAKFFFQSQDRSALERYLHYFHRYDVHEQSRKFEQALRNAGIAKMVCYPTLDMLKCFKNQVTMQNAEENRWIDVQYIDSGTEQLIEVRVRCGVLSIHHFCSAVGH
jgi:hypothetical protein